MVHWIGSYNFGSFWIDTAFPLNWIGSGSDLDPDAEILDRIGSRSNAVQVDRIGSKIQKNRIALHHWQTHSIQILWFTTTKGN